MSNKITSIILAIVIIATIVGVIVAVVIGNKGKDNEKVPVNTMPVISDTTTEPDNTGTVVPPVSTDVPDETDKPAETTEPEGDIYVDVIGGNPTEHEDEPKIQGDVVVIPGIKDESEGDGQ